MDFAELRRFVFSAYERGDYEAALAAIERYGPADLDDIPDVAFWRMCLLSLLGYKQEAIAEFADRLNEGFWWGGDLLADYDLNAVRDDPEWQRLAAVSSERAAEATTGLVGPLDIGPEGEQIGTLVLLHGFASRPREILDQHRPALAWGYRLIALHGTVPVATARFAWPAEHAVDVATSQLHEVDNPERTILLRLLPGCSHSRPSRLVGPVRHIGRVPRGAGARPRRHPDP